MADSNVCANCGKTEFGEMFYRIDYCATCKRKLCKDCMSKGCCGNTPAKSGKDDEYENETIIPAG